MLLGRKSQEFSTSILLAAACILLALGLIVVSDIVAAVSSTTIMSRLVEYEKAGAIDYRVIQGIPGKTHIQDSSSLCRDLVRDAVKSQHEVSWTFAGLLLVVSVISLVAAAIGRVDRVTDVRCNQR